MLLERGVEQRQTVQTNLRLRDAIRRMGRVDSGDELLALLRRTFGLGSFARVEVWVSDSLAAGIVDSADVSFKGDGYFWGENLRDEADWIESSWEVCLRLTDDDAAEPVGRVSIFRCEDDSGSTTTMRLMKQEFAPALLETLERLKTMSKDPREIESPDAECAGARGSAERQEERRSLTPTD